MLSSFCTLVSICRPLPWLTRTRTLPKHEEQLDPTQITAIPYNMRRLGLYVALSVLMMTEASNGMRLKRFAPVVPTTMTFVITMLICSDTVYLNPWQSILAAFYMANLVTFDPPIFASSIRPSLQRLRLPQSCHQPQECIASMIVNATIATTIPFQILLLYDRGWQVQRWPVPCILGSTVGWAIGCVSGTIWGMLLPNKVSFANDRTK